MPIYEYMCNDCERPFEELVLSATTPVACPVCNGTHIARLMSVVNSHSHGDSGRGAPAPMAAGPAGGCCGRGGCGCG